MSDNVTTNPGAGGPAIATDEVTYSGDIAQVQLVRLVSVSGAEGSKTVGSADAATETTLAAMNAKLPASGQATMAGSQPVVIASNQTAIPVLEAATILTGQAAQTAAVNNILEAAAGAAGTDVSNARSASVQVVSTGTGGTFIFEQSNSGAAGDWIPLPVFNAALATAVPITAAITASASAIIYTIPLRCRFLRLRIATTITGGSIQAFSRISSEPWTATVQAVAQATAANLLVQASVAGYPTAAASADGLANPTVTQIGAASLLFNGTTWDRARGNTAVSAEASSAKTTTGQGAALVNQNARGVQLVVNVSASSGTTPTLVVRAQVQDPVSSNWVDIPGAATASITGNGQTLLTVYPGANPVANAVVSQPLGRNWRLAWVIGGTTPSFTFSVGAQYIL